MSNKNIGHDIMIAKFKKYLSSNQYDIEYIDMLDGLGNNAYNTIIEHAQYNFQLTLGFFLKIFGNPQSCNFPHYWKLQYWQ